MGTVLSWFKAGGPWLYIIGALGLLLFVLLFERGCEALSPYWKSSRRKQAWNDQLNTVYRDWKRGDALEDLLTREKKRLTAGTTFIAGLVQVLIMLGLLGTVSGLMSAYQAQTGGMEGGIDKALLTTQYALVLAIPGMFFHRLWSRRSDLLYDRGRQLVNEFLLETES
ncbi:MotA/TolQ/ExbB proton channel family protein [Pontiella agarivorans]|uniref:MotA/TolQ/ExbB proton channel family protein n=1 Tax=Pontiella agarivorans TaxID=3038953 RepID=A0ABU5MV88_9BACT|nr:MotA/TolQ/ExbB proton channel family protein [Pontiella agarivorans]MDZ8118144.1 MotA/TolQ/ExbB proton channel family protein [Pontiella agarivorans]